MENPQRAKIIEYARSLARDLQGSVIWQDGDLGNRGWWTSSNPQMLGYIHGRAVAALEFFRQHSGVESHWNIRAVQTWESQGNHQSVETGAYLLGDLLAAWTGQVESGITEIAGERAWSEVGTVSTDVMAQVRRLIEDQAAHPAAAIVLCGAALETALRATVEARALSLPNKQRPSLNSYTQLLRSAGLFTAQDVKDMDMCGGLRNSAAHGHFDDLSPERAGFMEQQTNLLLRKLSDLATVGDGPA